MCGDIPGYKSPSKVNRASAAACLEVPCTTLGSLIYNRVQILSIPIVGVGCEMPSFKCNLAFTSMLAGIVMYVPEKQETRQDIKTSHHPILSVYCFAAKLATRNAAVLKLAALTKG